MSSLKVTSPDSEFLNAGQEEGICIWRIENFKVVKIAKKEFGTFYTGDSYLLLHTKGSKNSRFEWNIHYWLGAESTVDEYGTCAIKAIELDDYLNGRPIQHREVQFHESDLFLSYFNGSLRYLNGGYQSGFTNIKDIEYSKKLFMVKGKKDIRIVQVPFNIDSLNKSDVFILDEGAKVFQWNPPGASRMERLKAAVFAKKIRDDDHCGKAELITLDEDWDRNREFWTLMNGTADQIKVESDVKDEDFEKKSQTSTNIILYRVSDANTWDVWITKVASGVLNRSMLDSNDCFIVDKGVHGIFCWIGKNCTTNEKKSTVLGAKNLIKQNNYPNYLPLTSVIDGGETTVFKALFSDWAN